MSGKIKHSVVFISLLSFLSFFINGCGNTAENQKTAQINNEIQETKPLAIPQYELIETPKYKELKKQFEQARAEMNELQAKKNKLEVIYTKDYPMLKKISKDFDEAEKRLIQLEILLREETEKLEKRPINPPV